jgi:hypothetical protein
LQTAHLPRAGIRPKDCLLRRHRCLACFADRRIALKSKRTTSRPPPLSADPKERALSTSTGHALGRQGVTQCHKDGVADGGVGGDLQTAKERLASVFPISPHHPNIWYRLIGSYWKWYRLRIYPTSVLSPTCVTAAWCGPIAIMLARKVGALNNTT